jgi:hypothetical protein
MHPISSTFTVEISWFLLTLFFFGNLLISMFVALLFTLAFESPFIKVEKLVLEALMAAPRSQGEKNS